MASSPRILVALSGGLDSSVAAALLKKQGCECLGVHLKFWFDPLAPADPAGQFPQNKCCSLEAWSIARQVADKLGLPFYTLNFHEQFYRAVVQDFLKKYSAGATPNPCTVCNREIKFGLLIRRAQELNCDFVATGHYARITQDTAGKYHLWRGADPAKDQSYFLYSLNQKKLARILFPVGHLKKTAVKKLAQEFGLGFWKTQKESQGACFFPEEEPREFLRRHLSQKFFTPGPIVSVDGKIFPAQHEGLPLYTIGQRRGIGIGGVSEPLYVVRRDWEKNTLVVGADTDVYSEKCLVKNLNFIAGVPPKNAQNLTVQIRYRAKSFPAEMKFVKKTARIEFSEPVRAITPGQNAVFYRGEKVVGGGTIGR